MYPLELKHLIGLTELSVPQELTSGWGHLRRIVKASSSLTRSSSLPFFCGSWPFTSVCCYHGFPRGEQNKMQMLDPGVIHLCLCLGLVSHSQDYGCGEFRRLLCRVEFLRFEKTSLSSTGERKHRLHVKQLPSIINQCIPGLMSFFQIYIKVNTATTITSFFMDL